ncbi:hypothetical protein ACOMHN_004527 [Nucella lapillus]
MTAMSNHTASNTTNATSAAPPECIVLQFGDFIPWNNPDNIISFETEDLIRRLKDVFFLPVLFLIGCPANVINMAVFFKQGLKERINVCLFALSLADGMYLFCNMVCYGEQLYVQFTTREIYGPVMQWITNHYLLGFYGFTTVSQILSAIIAAERCFCILQPLRSRSVLQTSTTTTIIVVIFVVVIGFYFLVVSRYHILCAYNPLTDSVIMTAIGGEFYYRNKQLVDILDAFVYGVGLPGVVMGVVMLTTVVTTVKLRQAAEWRAQISSRGGGEEEGDGGMSLRDLALTRMLVYNSVFFITCVLPVFLFKMVLLFLPEMNAGRRQHNLFVAGLWVINITTYVNSTFNWLIYYTMGTRYRHTLRALLCRGPTANRLMTQVLTGACGVDTTLTHLVHAHRVVVVVLFPLSLQTRALFVLNQ